MLKTTIFQIFFGLLMIMLVNDYLDGPKGLFKFEEYQKNTLDFDIFKLGNQFCFSFYLGEMK